MFFNFCAVSTMSYTEKREDHNKTHSEPLHRNQAEQEFLSPLRWILGFVAQALIDSHEYVKVYFLWANPITCQGRWDGCFCILSLGKFLSNPGCLQLKQQRLILFFLPPRTHWISRTLNLVDGQVRTWLFYSTMIGEHRPFGGSRHQRRLPGEGNV